MKRLFVKFAKVFVPMGLALVVLASLQYRKECQFFKEKFNLQSGTQIVLLGDSHLRCGIDPSVLGPAQSFAQDGEPLWVTAEKLERIVKSAPKTLSYIIVGLPLHAPYFIFGRKNIYLSDRASHFPHIFHCQAFQDAETRWQQTWIALNGTRMLVRRFFHRQQNVDFVGGFKPQQGSVFNKKTRRDFIRQNIDAKFGDHDRFTRLNERFLSVLSEMIAISTKHRVTIVFVETPCTQIYREQIPNVYVQQFDEIRDYLKKHGCIYLDYSDLPTDKKYFFDGDHLNEQGVARFTPVFCCDLFRKLNVKHVVAE